MIHVHITRCYDLLSHVQDFKAIDFFSAFINSNTCSMLRKKKKKKSRHRNTSLCCCLLKKKKKRHDITEKQQLQSSSPEMKTAALALDTFEMEHCITRFSHSSLVYLCGQHIPMTYLLLKVLRIL